MHELLTMAEFKDIFDRSMLTFLKGYKGELQQPITDIVKAGGKRLRPYIIYLFSRNNSKNLNNKILLAGILPELIHTASLIHDDIIDNTEVRRGLPTIHSKWNTRVAVLSGDLIFSLVLKAIGKLQGDFPFLIEEIVKVIEDMIEGQAIEERIANSSIIPEIELLKQINSLKTSSLFSLTFAIGSSIISSEKVFFEKVKKLGDLLGDLFQIHDDLMDIFGSKAISGKDPLNDIKEGITTIPVALACHSNPQLVHTIENFKDNHSQKLIREIRLQINTYSAPKLLLSTKHAVKDFTYLIKEICPDSADTFIDIVKTVQKGIQTMLNQFNC